ncbi:hypothetical protein [Paraburkholderia acidisoli]|uniref:Uncharacterized protein n=1 Tax=Paraburkholderia acidisoli TaxID=2571748 RepID=A0A7Z2JE99_9BURK|nr:hypothetical protein [Paraburkholderia acidisoli]QGZ60728.1 hypothetical protein FAZ98_02670 [Paraburkholderia acidisoli]
MGKRLAPEVAGAVVKALLFCGLFLLAGRYVHTYPLPMTTAQQHALIAISTTFGIEDFELFYIVAMIVIDLIVASLVYRAIVGLWLRYRARPGARGARP